MDKIQIENLTLTYESPGKKFTALENLNLSVKEGEFVCIIGPSGCGKSTLLSVIEGLKEATSGRVLIDSKEVKGPASDRGIVFQHYSLFPWLTTVGNVVFAMKQNKIKGNKKQLEERAKHYLTKVGLEDSFDKYPAELSGGMQQRVAIARILAANASLFLMDEPFGTIDPKNRQELQELVSALVREEKKTVLFVTHDIEEAILLADRIIFINNHNIQADINVGIQKPITKAQLIDNERFRQLNTELMSLFYKGVAENIADEVYL